MLVKITFKYQYLNVKNMAYEQLKKAICALAHECDGAVEKDRCGFNKPDSNIVLLSVDIPTTTFVPVFIPASFLMFLGSATESLLPVLKTRCNNILCNVITSDVFCQVYNLITYFIHISSTLTPEDLNLSTQVSTSSSFKSPLCAPPLS